MSNVVRKQAEATATGTALRRFIVPRMPLDKQESVIGLLDVLVEKTIRLRSIYQNKIAALAELKQSMLQEAFAGNL
jgi:type I restriction enzyme S subunit